MDASGTVINPQHPHVASSDNVSVHITKATIDKFAVSLVPANTQRMVLPLGFARWFSALGDDGLLISTSQGAVYGATATFVAQGLDLGDTWPTICRENGLHVGSICVFACDGPKSLKLDTFSPDGYLVASGRPKNRNWRLFIREPGISLTAAQTSMLRNIGRTLDPKIPIFVAHAGPHDSFLHDLDLTDYAPRFLPSDTNRVKASVRGFKGAKTCALVRLRNGSPILCGGWKALMRRCHVAPMDVLAFVFENRGGGLLRLKLHKLT